MQSNLQRIGLDWCILLQVKAVPAVGISIKDPKDGNHIFVEPCQIALSTTERVSGSSPITRKRAVLGMVETVTTKTGAETKHPVSTLTLFDKEGKVVFQAPE